MKAEKMKSTSLLRNSMRKAKGLFLLLSAFILHPSSFILSAPLVLQSDFGVKDGAVAAMKGVAVGVNPDLKIYDLTHEIPAFNVWEGAYRLWQTAPYWPAGTVFVSVVDPGVGTNAEVGRRPHEERANTSSRPTTARSRSIAEKMGIDAVREIDETKNRRRGFRGKLHVPRPRRVRLHRPRGWRRESSSLRGGRPGMLDPAKIVTISSTNTRQ